jgi:hypothetical protein
MPEERIHGQPEHGPKKTFCAEWDCGSGKAAAAREVIIGVIVLATGGIS